MGSRRRPGRARVGLLVDRPGRGRRLRGGRVAGQRDRGARDGAPGAQGAPPPRRPRVRPGPLRAHPRARRAHRQLRDRRRRAGRRLQGDLPRPHDRLPDGAAHRRPLRGRHDRPGERGLPRRRDPAGARLRPGVPQGLQTRVRPLPGGLARPGGQGARRDPGPGRPGPHERRAAHGRAPRRGGRGSALQSHELLGGQPAHPAGHRLRVLAGHDHRRGRAGPHPHRLWGHEPRERPVPGAALLDHARPPRPHRPVLLHRHGRHGGLPRDQALHLPGARRGRGGGRLGPRGPARARSRGAQRRRLLLRRHHPGAARHGPAHRAGRARRPGRAVGRGQIDGVGDPAGVQAPRRGDRPHRRRRSGRSAPGLGARPHGGRRADHLPVLGFSAREPAGRQARRHRRPAALRPARRPPAGPAGPPARRPRHHGRRARPGAVGRRGPARRHRPRHPQGRLDPHPRRAHGPRRPRQREGDPRRAAQRGRRPPRPDATIAGADRRVDLVEGAIR